MPATDPLPKEALIPDPTTTLAPLVSALRGYGIQYSVLSLRCARALDHLRNRQGRITDTRAAQRAIADRNRDLAALYTELLLPHTGALLARARQGLAAMPPARHHAGWRLLVDDLAHAAEQARRHLDNHSDGDDPAVRDALLWPFLQSWGEHDVLLRDLALQPAQPHAFAGLTSQEEELWTDIARSARNRDLLRPVESWYDAGGQLITIAYAVVFPHGGNEDVEDSESVLALSGDIDSPAMRVIGHYEDRGRRAGPAARGPSRHPVPGRATAPARREPGRPYADRADPRCRRSPSQRRRGRGHLLPHRWSAPGPGTPRPARHVPRHVRRLGHRDGHPRGSEHGRSPADALHPGRPPEQRTRRRRRRHGRRGRCPSAAPNPRPPPPARGEPAGPGHHAAPLAPPATAPAYHR